MQVLYQPILNIQLWHDYYLGQPEMPNELATNYDISSIFRLVPTVGCQIQLRNLRWLARPLPEGMTLLAEVNEVVPGSPNPTYHTKISVNQPTRLTFWLEIKDPTFANFTNLPFTANREQIYYFSNQLGTVQNYPLEGDIFGTDYLFLNRSLTTYGAGEEYPLGQLVINGVSTLESTSYQVSASATPSEADWETLPLSQYVTDSDLMPYQGITRTEAIASVNPGETYSFSLVDANGQSAFTQTLTVGDSHPPGASILAHLNFRGQSPGRYQLMLDGTLVGEFIVFDRQAAPNAFALVELVIDPTATDAFALLQADGGETLIQPRTYILRFKNRATRWRYRTQTPHELTAGDLAPMLELVDDQTFVTSRPRGLLQKPNPPPLRTPNPPPLDGERNLPFPSAIQIKPVVDADRRITQVFSDIYL